MVRVGDWRLRVIGVLAPRGVQLGIDMDDIVVVPVATAMKMFNRSGLFRLLIQVRSHADLERAKQAVLRLLSERHGEEDVTVITQDAVLSAFSSILGALTLALGGIAAISLAVAGIGIMNVMLVSVSERTREIGLLKALGAGRRQILAAFLPRRCCSRSAGGLLGLALGWLAVLAIAGRDLPGASRLAAAVGGGRRVLALGRRRAPSSACCPPGARRGSTRSRRSRAAEPWPTCCASRWARSSPTGCARSSRCSGSPSASRR